jgi:hypothetical protein
MSVDLRPMVAEALAAARQAVQQLEQASARLSADLQADLLPHLNAAMEHLRLAEKAVRLDLLRMPAE